MLKSILASGTALAAVCTVFIAPAAAQTAAASTAPAQADDQSSSSDDIIVTGSTRAQRRFDVSYAINTVSQEDIQKIAPVNFADLIGQLPGFQTEITGGEVQNIYRIRGLPNDGGFVSFQQDGLPLFHENDGVFFRGDAILKQDLMTDRVEVVRGGPAPVYASYSGAIINAITVTGSDVARGKAQVTLGDTGLYRLDAYQAGPLGEKTYYAIGGFMRYHDGYRDNGFPNDKGGQIRANIKHEMDNGFIKLNVNYVNDHNVFYLPIPTNNPLTGESLNQYIDYFDGTMNSPAFRHVNLKYRDGNGVVQSRNSDLSDGRHMQMLNFGVHYEGDFDGWLVTAAAGYTQGKNDFTRSIRPPTRSTPMLSPTLISTAPAALPSAPRASAMCWPEPAPSTIPMRPRAWSCRASTATSIRSSTRARPISRSPSSSRRASAAMTSSWAFTAASMAKTAARFIRTT